MADNPSDRKPSPPLNDIDYFDYFKSQKGGWIYDEFCKLWEDFDLKKFDVITHYSTLQVYKLMIEKRIKYFAEISSLSEELKEKDKFIGNLEREKQEAIQNVNKEIAENLKLQFKIKDLESEMEETKDVSEIPELKNRIEEMEADVEHKVNLIQKYRDERDSAEKKFQETFEKFKKADIEIKALKNTNEQLKANFNASKISVKQFQTEKEETETELNAVKDSVKQLQTQNESIQKENDKLKEDSEAKDMKLGDIKTQFQSTQEELEEYKEKCQSFEETKKNNNQLQIEVQQLQQALNCSTEQIQKLESELLETQIATNDISDRKMAALNEFAKSVKDCGILKKMVAKASPSRKELIERIKAIENENQLLTEKSDGCQVAANDITLQYQKMFNDNRQLKIDLENAQKRREKLDKAAEKRKKSKEHQEIMQQQNGNGEGSSKRARLDMHPSNLNISAQQFVHDCVICSHPMCPLDIPPRLVGHGQPSSRFPPFCPEFFNPNFPPPPNLNFLCPQHQQQFWHHRQHQQMMMMSQQRFTSNYSGNPSITHHPQQQIPAPNFIPEMLPPRMQQQNPQYHQICYENSQPQRRIPPSFNFPPSRPPLQQLSIQQHRQNTPH